MSKSIAIIGGGFAGLAAAQRAVQLGQRVDLYEKNQYLGGHASSMQVNGFTFDEGPHVSFTAIPDVKDMLATSIQGKHHEFASIVANYFGGTWIKHPAPVNLYGLPVGLVTKCIMDFLEVSYGKTSSPSNYGEWLHDQYGKTFSREFPYRYTRKYWTVEPEEMTTDWIGPRMYRPTVEEVIRGAIGEVSENKHYITAFRYPQMGGFGTYAQALHSDAAIHTNHAVDQIDVGKKTLRFENGSTVEYDCLISSLPLPELIPRIVDVPTAVSDATKNLSCTSLALVEVGVSRDSGFPSGHWLYFYDEDICFARSNYPHELAASNAPLGCGSVQVEVYYSRHRPLSTKNILDRAINDMLKVGLLLPTDKILVSQCRHIKYGNVLYDKLRKRNLSIIEAYLDELGIVRCGRYGLWNYHWTDQSIVSGWEAAEKIVQAE